MKLERIDSSNERELRRYVEGLTSKYSRDYDRRNKAGFEKYLAKIRKEKALIVFEKLAKEVNDKSNTLTDMKKSLEEVYGLDVEAHSYCGGKPFDYKTDYNYDYQEGTAVIKEEGQTRCNYEKSNEIIKAILEKNIARVNELVSELETKAGVQ